MNHRGKAFRAALRIVMWVAVACIAAVLLLGWILPTPLLVQARLVVVGLSLVAIAFTFYFFRDPEPRAPPDPKLIFSPAHGTVDQVEVRESIEALGTPVRRVSIFLSVFDVHVQRAAVAGKVTQFVHTPGKYLNALKAESALHNENVLIVIEPSAQPGRRIGLRLIAGLIARRIVPWIALGEELSQGQRISLIQFGSRVDIYLPMHCEVAVAVGQRVVGGETVVARFTS